MYICLVKILTALNAVKRLFSAPTETLNDYEEGTRPPAHNRLLG